ncbi:murein biosynthesis integral membrane protein MurJ [Desulfonatronovibrio magnus]|uniref:murein biosynthesis integral membrane protein MurJ n=1 Tax=Desulfonatronovibrio magnus TaxID=698827 RepID=UPI0005EB5451|nr:murein biosynthesis integral membrane protein MurJ [Desulfonatronovibrio magnus]RQD61838.1 MAG: murein biosynthesis integral membrane protein MurJ [Desulfonatronovibrio sp. MSAO_Bac4]
MNSKQDKHSSGSLARKASVVAGATLLSRVLGFIRDLIIAFALGAGPMADAFFVAFRLPNLLRRLFAEGSLTMAFIPVFTKTRDLHGQEEAFILARSVQLWLLIIVGIITLLAIIFAAPLTALIAPGFKNDPETFDAAVTLVRICFPYILFISAVALCMGILNSLNHFFAPAAAPAIMNLTLIAFALSAYLSGGEVALFLSAGVFFSGILQWFFQYPFLKKAGFSWKGSYSLSHPGISRIGKLMLPTIFGAAVYQINILIGTILASFLAAGSISYLYYADRLVQFPLGVFAVAISTAALPSLSSLAGQGDITNFKKTLNTSLNLTLFIALPSTAGLIGLSYPLIEIIFGRGEFGPTAIQATSLALVGFAAGLPAFSCVRPLISAFYALEDTKTPVKIAVVSLIVNIILSIVLMQKLQHTGLALAASISSWVNIILLILALNKKIGRWLTETRSILKMTGASCVLLLSIKFLSMPSWAAVACIPVWGMAYFMLARALQIPETIMILKIFYRKSS